MRSIKSVTFVALATILAAGCTGWWPASRLATVVDLTAAVAVFTTLVIVGTLTALHEWDVRRPRI